MNGRDDMVDPKHVHIDPPDFSGLFCHDGTPIMQNGVYETDPIVGFSKATVLGMDDIRGIVVRGDTGAILSICRPHFFCPADPPPKPEPLIRETAHETLASLALQCEHYADAYAGSDAPFPDQVPSVEILCRIVQDMSRAAHVVLSDYDRLRAKYERLETALDEARDELNGGRGRLAGPGQVRAGRSGCRKSQTNSARR